MVIRHSTHDGCILVPAVHLQNEGCQDRNQQYYLHQTVITMYMKYLVGLKGWSLFQDLVLGFSGSFIAIVPLPLIEG